LPIKLTLKLTATSPWNNNTWPSDTLVWQASPPSWTSGFTGGGWLGSAVINPTSGYQPGNYVYWFNQGQLFMIRQLPTFISVGLDGGVVPTCPEPTFSWVSQPANIPWQGAIFES
jgi:hypothetical protein